MARTYDEVLKDALSLTEEERAALAEALDDSRLTEEEREIKAEWDAEIDRRIADHEAGLTQGIPLEEVIANAQAKLREDREARRVRSRG